MSDHAHVTGDVVSGLAVAGTWMGFLQTDMAILATIAATIWYSIQIWDWWIARRRKNDAQDE